MSHNPHINYLQKWVERRYPLIVASACVYAFHHVTRSILTTQQSNHFVPRQEQNIGKRVLRKLIFSSGNSSHTHFILA